MGIKQLSWLYKDNLRKLTNDYGDVSVMWLFEGSESPSCGKVFSPPPTPTSTLMYAFILML